MRKSQLCPLLALKSTKGAENAGNVEANQGTSTGVRASAVCGSVLGVSMNMLAEITCELDSHDNTNC